MEPNNHDRETRVLLLAPTLRDGEVTQMLLSREAISCVMCTDLHEVAREIVRGAGVLLMTEEALTAPGIERVLSLLDEQFAWSDLPVLLLMRGGTQSDTAGRVIRALRNVTLLERPAAMRSLVSAVQAALRGRARQYETREQIEALRRAEARARELQEQFQAMANSIPQLAWMGKPDGWIFWYNQRWHQYCGSTPEQMEGWGWERVHDPKELPRVVKKWQSAVEAGTEWEDTFPLRRHDGVYRWHLSRAMPFRDDSGKIVLWFGTNTDISEERARAEERERLLQSERVARAESERAGRMKDEFLATLSHELRTPLNAILGWSQLIRRGMDDRELLVEGLSVIERNTRIQVQLIEDLLDMSRIISGKIRMDIQSVDLAVVINSAIETVTPAADAKGIRVLKVLDPRAGPIAGDHSRLQQVVWNLLSNAIKFTPKGGRVQVILQRESSHIEISVSDTGQGIKPAFLPYVFERFRQEDASTTRAHGGLGLGLAIVKQLIELHGGKILAHSAGEGCGSTFTIKLPLSVVDHVDEQDVDRASQSKKSPRACEFVSLEGLKVLVVDDEPDARDLMRRVLEECQVTVLTAGSATEGLSCVETNRPDVVISDIGMPVVDGYEFLRKVRSLGPVRGGSVPAIALTAFARSEDRTRALLAGFMVHLSKPVEPGELVATIAALSGRTKG